MANLPINLLPLASSVNNDALFVIQQNGEAKSVQADTFREQWIGEGAQFKPKGYYSSLTALRAAVPNPALGDYYYVGASTPYHVYAALDIGQANPWKDVGTLGTDVRSNSSQLILSSGVNSGTGEISSVVVGSTTRQLKDSTIPSWVRSQVFSPRLPVPIDYEEATWQTVSEIYNAAGFPVINWWEDETECKYFPCANFDGALPSYQFQCLLPGNKVSYITVPRTGAVTRTPFEVLVSASSPNLLDNPFFQINQRGASSYTGAGYTVDRWYQFFAGGRVTVNANGTVTLTSTSASEPAAMFQIFEKPLTPNTDYVFTVRATSGSQYISLSVYDTNYGFVQSIQSGQSFRVTENNADRIGIYVSQSHSATIEAAKLEHGTVSTLAKDNAPNYATELLKCLRFYWRFSSINDAWYSCSYPAGYGGLTVALQAGKMRTTPVLQIDGALQAFSSTWVNINTSSVLETPRGYELVAHPVSTSGFTEGRSYILKGAFALSADM